MDVKTLAEKIEAFLSLSVRPLIKKALWEKNTVPLIDTLSLDAEEENLFAFMKDLYGRFAELGLLSREHAPEEAWRSFTKNKDAIKSLLRDNLPDGFWGEFTRGRDIDEEILAFFFLIVRRKLLRELADLARRDGLLENNGNCPVCGRGPAFATIVSEGRRRVYCNDCLVGWYYYRIGCPSCGSRNHEHFIELHPENSKENVFAELCLNCGSYIKTRVLGVDESINPVLEDASTLYLDYLARDTALFDGSRR